MRINIKCILSRLPVFIIFVMIFGEAYGVTIIGNLYRIILGVLGCLSLFIYVIFHKIKYTNLDLLPFLYTLIALFLLLVSIFFWSGTHNIYSYLGLVVALLVYVIDFDFSNKLIRFLLILTFLLAGIEFLTKQYLFINVVRGIEFDEKLMGGTVGVFRSKGLFYGPTILGMFVAGAYLLNYKKFSYLFLALLSSFFANARLGIVLLSIPLFFMIIKKENRKYFLIIILAFIALITYSLSNSSQSIERLMSVGESGSQSARIDFWLSGLNLFFNYSLPYLFFGDNGLFYELYDNNPESGWICLLTDNGIVGFLFYLIPLVYCFFRFLGQKEYFLTLIVLVFAAFNFAITFHLSGTGNLMYWLIMFEFLNKAVYGYSKLGLNSIERKGKLG